MKRTDNKGFSLIELIFVIEIMEVLVDIFEHNLKMYLARSKKTADEKNLDEFHNAVLLAATEAIMSEPPVNVISSGATDATYVFKYDAVNNKTVFDAGDSRNSNAVTGFANLVLDIVGNSKIKSKNGQEKIVVTIAEGFDGEYNVQLAFAS
jgi:Tfp pilus assembly protein FimT